MISEHDSLAGLSDGQIGIGLLVHLIALTIILLSVGCVEVSDPDHPIPVVQAESVPEWDLKVDKVLVLNSVEEAAKLSTISNLLFEKDGVIITNGFKVSLNLHHLESHGGKIITFLKNQTAQPKQPGRSGGMVDIKADVAIGDLSVEMRGENGGSGTPYSMPDSFIKTEIVYPGLSGGIGGDSGFLFIEIANSEKLRVMDLHEPGFGAPGGPPTSPYSPALPGNKGSTCFIENGKRNCR